MREILFRGKRFSGEWEFGDYVTLSNGYGKSTNRIYNHFSETDCEDFYPYWEEVIPETVGQYTGLTDKNGKKIFEGDIVTINDYTPMSEYDGRKFIVKYLECGFFAEPIGHPEQAIRLYNECAEYEIIGNIYDNPKLLEV